MAKSHPAEGSILVNMTLHHCGILMGKIKFLLHGGWWTTKQTWRC